MTSQKIVANEQQAAARPEEQLRESTDQFKKAGGFDLLEAVIDDAQNLNPARKARREIFLNEASKKTGRRDLLQRLNIWEQALSDSGDAVEIASRCEQNLEETDTVLKANLKNALDQTRDLEQSYRSVGLFFKNAEEDKVNNVSLMNADMEQLTDLDFSRFIDVVSETLSSNYDRLDLRENYSLLVIPGYLGSNAVLEKWMKIAHENKVMLITDFDNFDTPDDVMEMFEAANLTGGERHRSNVIMTCNWIRGRERVVEVGEDDSLYIPAAGAYAGKIYGTLMSQVAAGKKFGSINEVDSVRFSLKKSEIANIEKLGLVPMVSEYGKVMAFSAKTLFNGDNLGLQTYSVVRVFDYITKVLMDFLNRRAFENFDSRTKKNLLRQIVTFLDSVTGPDNLIENFDIRRFEQDPDKKDHINLDVHLRPFFPAKNFLIKMDGHKGDDGNEWDAEYEQH
ncbi:MAG TPA: DUF5458 family protein [Fodinibius sp.]|nr:DUF5458 family protein [Fodinibius sp.]